MGINHKESVQPVSADEEAADVCCVLLLHVCVFRSWDKVFCVLGNTQLSTYKDQKHAKTVSRRLNGSAIEAYILMVLCN